MQDIVGRAAELVPGDVALLVRDRGAWPVAACIGLRRLELSQIPTDGHLVTTLGDSHSPITVIAVTDAVRARLVGAPLASRRSLLVASLAPVPAILMIGRSDAAFSPDDVKALGKALGGLRAIVEFAVRWRDIVAAMQHLR